MRADEDLAALIRPLRQVLALGPELLVCSHAGLIKDACGAIDRKITCWETQGVQAQMLHRAVLSVREITKRLLGNEGLLTSFSSGRISKINLIRSLLTPPSPHEGKDPGDRCPCGKTGSRAHVSPLCIRGTWATRVAHWHRRR